MVDNNNQQGPNMITTQLPRKHFILSGKIVALAFLSSALAGCVAEQPGHYGTYPAGSSTSTTSTTTYYAPQGSSTTVIIQSDGVQPAADDGRDYDNHWDYGRRGNGNFHGTGDDDVHDD